MSKSPHPNSESFFARHKRIGGSATEALHCFYCDHECSTNSVACCDCGVDIGGSTYPLRTATQWNGIDQMATSHHFTEASFPQFQDLPYEIRIKIWELALPEPRVVLLEAHHLKWFGCTRVWSDREAITMGDRTIFKDDTKHNMKQAHPLRWGPGRNLVGFKSDCSIPAMLCVCRESFEVASQVYSRAFGSVAAFPETWFNFQLDTLYLDYGWPHGLRYNFDQLGGDIEKVERLALFAAPFHDSDDDPENLSSFIFYHLLASFKTLKKLSIVVKRHNIRETTDLVFENGVYDIDASFAFYSKQFNLETATEFYRHRNPSQRVMPDMKYLGELAAERSPRHDPKEGIPDIFPGFITTTHKRDAHHRAYESWTVQKMAYDLEPLEYRIFFHPHEDKDHDIIPSSDLQLCPIDMHVRPTVSIKAIKCKLRELWEVPDEFEMKLSCAYVKLDPASLVGRVMELLPQPTSVPKEEKENLGYWTNLVKVEFTRSLPMSTPHRLEGEISDPSCYIFAKVEHHRRRRKYWHQVIRSLPS